jgi:tripartite-type tricarboxylate transporter receptor subunit TctC
LLFEQRQEKASSFPSPGVEQRGEATVARKLDSCSRLQEIVLNHHMNLRRLMPAALLGLALFGWQSAQAAFPEKTIRVVVPTAPGTPIDVVTRIVTTRMAKDLGQAVFVENKAGASGTLGGQEVLRSPADGYTLMTVFMPMSVAPSILTKPPPFDLRKDFAPVGQTAWSYNVLVVHPTVSARTAAELIALLKAQPGKLSYATGGLGTPAHMTGELFKIETKAYAVHVPYNQFGQAISDLIGGTHQFMFAASAPVLPFIEQGRLRALAVTGSKRMAALPQVPTLLELGFKDLVVRDWQGLMVRAGTPPDIIARLNASIGVALADPAVQQALSKLGVDPAGGTPAQLGALVDSEITRWSKVVKLQGLKSD